MVWEDQRPWMITKTLMDEVVVSQDSGQGFHNI